MKVTKVRAVTLIGFATGSLLLFLVASCCVIKGKPCGFGKLGKGKSFVANPFCLACHSDFEEENLVVIHEKAGLGCERCHGESERHRSDEANVTPPELMYPRSKVIPACMMCHPRQTIKHVPQHSIFLAGAKTTLDGRPEAPLKVCTNCHAKKHKMNVRTVRWNKATGEVLKEE